MKFIASHVEKVFINRLVATDGAKSDTLPQLMSLEAVSVGTGAKLNVGLHLFSANISFGPVLPAMVAGITCLHVRNCFLWSPQSPSKHVRS